MLADLRYKDLDNTAEVVISLANGKRIVGEMDLSDQVKIIENTTGLDNKHAELAAGIAYVMAKDHGEDYVVWKRFVDKVYGYKRILDAARLNIN